MRGIPYYNHPLPSRETKGEDAIREEERRDIALLLERLAMDGYLEDIRDRIRRLAHELQTAKTDEPLNPARIESRC